MTNLLYQKSIPDEVIEVGDILMIDPSNGFVRKAYLEQFYRNNINTRLTLGICTRIYNAPKRQLIDGYTAIKADRNLIDGSDSSVNETNLLEGGDSSSVTDETIELTFSGVHFVNTVRTNITW